MYHRILLPTDGSDLAAEAARYGIDLAKSIGASVVAFHALPRLRRIVDLEAASGLQDVDEQFHDYVSRRGQQYVAGIDAVAEASGVDCTRVVEAHDEPYHGIIEVAKREGCDLIVIGSHGRTGEDPAMLGGQTARLLLKSKVPVLVYRRSG